MSIPMNLHPDRLFPADASTRDLARALYATVKDLPIVMITSRIAEKHREHAAALGVNHYLGKPYSEEELLSLVRRYTEQAATA